MKTFLVLLRGVNVGGRNILSMKALASLLEENGCSNVKTYIQSGNVIFSREQSFDSIEDKIETTFGFKPHVLTISKNVFIECARNNPFKLSEGKEAHIYFCKETPDLDLKRIDALKSKSERYHIEGNAFYLFAPEGIARSKLAANIDRCLGVAATGRNLNTINKLAEMLVN